MRPQYLGPQSGRAGTDEERRGAWQLQEEYLAGRLGKNDEDNSRLWNTAKWIDRHFRVATMPAKAAKTLNVFADDLKDAINVDDLIDGFGVERVIIDERDKERLALKLSDYDLSRLVDDFKECDKLAKININKLVRNAYPLPERIDLPGPNDRQESIKILRMLMVGMRSLWYPVKRSIVDHATMKSLGKTQNVGDGVAATVGRARVIEGLRLAESIRRGLARQQLSFSMWLNQIHAKQTRVPSVEWRSLNRYKLGSVDEIIRETLAVLADESLPDAGPSWNLAAGPIIKIPDTPLPSNDNSRAASAARKAA